MQWGGWRWGRWASEPRDVSSDRFNLHELQDKMTVTEKGDFEKEENVNPTFRFLVDKIDLSLSTAYQPSFTDAVSVDITKSRKQPQS